MRKLVGVLPLLLIASLLTACGGSDDSCGAMVRTGVERGSSMEDADRALRSCPSVEVLEKANEEDPGLFVGTDIATFVSNRCAYNSDLRDYPICEK